MPLTTVVLKIWAPAAAGMGNSVGWITTKDVPLITVVLPSPAGRPEAGTVVKAGIMKTGVPDMKVVVPRLTGMGIPPGKGASVVAPETTRKLEPSISVVCPESPGGA